MEKYPVTKKIVEADLAFNKAKALQTLDALQMPIAIHLILVFSYPKAPETRGWMKELNSWRLDLTRKNRGKNNRSNFTHRNLYQGLWVEPLSEVGDRVARIQEIYQDKGVIISSIEPRLKEFKSFVDKFISSVENNLVFDLEK